MLCVCSNEQRIASPAPASSRSPRRLPRSPKNSRRKRSKRVRCSPVLEASGLTHTQGSHHLRQLPLCPHLQNVRVVQQQQPHNHPHKHPHNNKHLPRSLWKWTCWVRSVPIFLVALQQQPQQQQHKPPPRRPLVKVIQTDLICCRTRCLAGPVRRLLHPQPPPLVCPSLSPHSHAHTFTFKRTREHPLKHTHSNTIIQRAVVCSISVG